MTDGPDGEAASALRRVMPGVVDEVLRRLRDEVPQLRQRPFFHLRHALPELSEQLANAFGSGPHLVTGTPCDPVTSFWPADQQPQDLDQLLLEYQLLRETLPQALVAEMGRELFAEELSRLHSGIDLCLRQVSAHFETLQESRLQSEAAALAKYLSFLSHDLRGNLNGAMLMIEVLRRELSTEERFAEHLADLDAMRQSMLELVGTMDRFLQAERLRQGRVEVSLQSVNIAAFLEEQRRAMVRQHRGVEGRIEVEVSDPGMIVLTDREMLSLVIQNTLGNCVKYSEGRRVGMHATRLSDPARPEKTCRIQVSDSGPGMDEYVRGRLFEPFVRGIHTGKPGTGLGLFIAKQAADLLGAELTVQSRRGKGTTFTLDLCNSTFPPSAEPGAAVGR